MKIILEGTSSAGKSSIVKKFPNTFTKIAMDDLENNREELFKKLKNRYYTQEETDNIFVDIMDKRLSSKVKNKKKFIIDAVNMKGYPSIIKYLPKETMNTVLNERVLYLRQKLEQFKYDGPVPGNLDAIRNEKSVSFIRGLASALIETGLNYMEKNRGKLN